MPTKAIEESVDPLTENKLLHLTASRRCNLVNILEIEVHEDVQQHCVGFKSIIIRFFIAQRRSYHF
jgi:hypothetical protein